MSLLDLLAAHDINRDINIDKEPFIDEFNDNFEDAEKGSYTFDKYGDFMNSLFT